MISTCLVNTQQRLQPADNAPPLVAKHLREQRVAAGQAFTYQAPAGNGAMRYWEDIAMI